MAQAKLRADAGLRLTPVRRRVLEILLESHRAMGAYDILNRLVADGYGAQPPVAYRALDYLVAQGLVHRIRRLNAFAACMMPDRDHTPAFLICDDCRIVAEAPAAPARQALDAAAGAVGFELGRINLEATGLCQNCRAAKA